jgi:hypothetical protein
MDSQVQILGVNVGNTSTGKTFYAVQCSDGIERRCWNAQLAQKINSFAQTGQTVTLRYDVTQNGQYTNYSVKGVFGPGEVLAAEAAPMQAGLPSPMQVLPVGAPMGGPPMGTAAPQQSGGGKGSFPPEVTTRIVKMASFSDACVLVGGLLTGAGPEAFEQAMELVEKAAKQIYASSRSHEQGGPTTVQQGTITPVADNAAGVAEFANAQLPGAVQVGAPVATAAQQDAAAEAPDATPTDNVDWN